MGSDHGETSAQPEEDEGEKAIVGDREEEETEAADPESPNSKADSNSSSSEGVLVEHPVNADQVTVAAQESASSSHQDTGILVNIDGSMQENLDGDDGSREDSFEDAPDDLAFVEGRSSGGGLEESIAMIEIGESSGEKKLVGEVNRLQGLLAEALDECGRRKDEQELLAREVGNIQYQLKCMINRQPSSAGEESQVTMGIHPESETGEYGEDAKELLSTMSLHSALRDCSKLASHLRVSFDEQLQAEGTVKSLCAALDAKNQQVEDLHGKLSETLISRDVVTSYVESLRESSDAVVKKLLVSLSSVVQDYEITQDSAIDDNTLVEKKALLLIDRYAWFHYETEQLGQFLYSMGSKFAMPRGVEIGHVFDATRSELLEYSAKENRYIEKIRVLEEEKREILGNLGVMERSLKEVQSEASKNKTELEQMEQKFVSAKEKLSMAVTKGKSLVQQRDSLKQSLAETSKELEKYQLELQEKVGALEASEQSIRQLEQNQHLIASLQGMISEKDNILHAIEEAMSEFDFHVDSQSSNTTDRIRWLIHQKKISEEILLENNRSKHALTSFSLPGTILSTSLENQINWLGKSFMRTSEDLNNMQVDMISAQEALESCRSELSMVRNKIEQLTGALFVEKQEKYSIHVVNEDLVRNFKSMEENLSRLSSEKNGLMRVLGELSQCEMDDETANDVDFTGRCVEKIKEKINITSEPSSDVIESLQRLHSLLYNKDIELALCEKMLEEEMTGLSVELRRAFEEVESLRNEKESLQGALEVSENKYALIREKLSMAVKKGKGLVQEREGLKKCLEEQNSEIDRLKHELKLKESTVAECKQHITILTTDLEQVTKLESDIISLRNDKDQIELLLQERNRKLQKVIQSIEQIDPLPSDVSFEGTLERVKWFAQHVSEAEAGKIYAERELEKLKEQLAMQANKLNNAVANNKSLEDALSVAREHYSVVLEEKEEVLLSKSSVELELKKVKEVADTQSREIEQAFDRVNSLEEVLLNERKKISVLIDEKNDIELKSKQEITGLNTKIAACMEELHGTSSSFENQAAELTSQYRYLLSLLKEEGPLSLATERFGKNVKSLKDVAHLVESIHDQVNAGRLQYHPSSKQINALMKLYSLPELEEYINTKALDNAENMGEVADSPSFTKIVEGFTAHSKILDDRLTHISCYIDDQITLLVQALQEVSVCTGNIFEFGESYKQNINRLEASNKAQEVEISSLQNDLSILHSACSDALKCLKINFDEVLDLGHPLQTFASLEPDEAHVDATNESSKIATRIKNQIKQFSDTKNIWFASVDDLKTKLQKAELAAEAAYQENNIEHEKVVKLESEFKTLQIFCSELKSMVENYQLVEVAWKEREQEWASLQGSLVELKSTIKDHQSQELIWKDKENELALLQKVCTELKSIKEDYQSKEMIWKEKEIELKSMLEDYQSKDVVWKAKDKELNSLQSVCSELNSMVEDYKSREVMWKEREKEFASLQHSLTIKDSVESEKLILEGQLASIFEKVNTKVPLLELEAEGQKRQFSSAMDKTNYILNSVDTLRDLVCELTDEKEKLQTSLAVQVDETKHLKMAAENLVSNNKDLESRCNDLNDLTMRLERILQEYGDGNSLLDKKLDAKGLLSLLERLIMTSIQESESSKLRAQELGATLFTTQKIVDELSAKVKSLEDSISARLISQDNKNRSIYESSSTVTTSEISEVEDVAIQSPHGKSSLSPPPAAALRPMHKGSNDHLILNIDAETDRLIGPNDSEVKGHVFKSLNTSGLIPKQGKLIADRVDSIWVSGGRILMGRPRARIGLIMYWIMLHIWVVAITL